MIKVRIITPMHSIPVHFVDALMQEVAPYAKAGILFDHAVIGCGPSSVENHFDEMLSAPYMVARIIEAEQNGIDAVIINCMGDPGLFPARETVSIPVIGPCEASMHAAAMMGHRFAVVSVLESVRSIFERNANLYGVAGKMVSIRMVDIPVLDIADGHDVLIERLFDQSKQAIENDHADTIILGCTGFTGVAEELQRRLFSLGLKVPVVNPLPTAAVMAAAFVHAGLSHSPHAYPTPNKAKMISGYDIPSWRDK